MNRQHPCPHFTMQIIQILAIFSEIWIHCQYLLTDPRMLLATETDSVICQDNNKGNVICQDNNKGKIHKDKRPHVTHSGAMAPKLCLNDELLYSKSALF